MDNILMRRLGALTVCLALVVLSSCSSQDEVVFRPDGKPAHQKVALAGQTFELELALTIDERHVGLSGRPPLEENEGMLFVYPDEPPYPVQLHFWMKDCPAPIDVIFIDRGGIIVSIHEMQPPEPDTPDDELELYSSGRPAQFAIELQGGRAAELGLKVGDVINLDWGGLIKLAEE